MHSRLSEISNFHAVNKLRVYGAEIFVELFDGVWNLGGLLKRHPEFTPIFTQSKGGSVISHSYGAAVIAAEFIHNDRNDDSEQTRMSKQEPSCCSPWHVSALDPSTCFQNCRYCAMVTIARAIAGCT